MADQEEETQLNSASLESRSLVGSQAALIYGSLHRSEQEAQKKLASVSIADQTVSLKTLFQEMSWRKRLTAMTASLVNFSSMACFAIMAPFLPLQADAKGISSTSVGVIFACFELVMFLASIVFGRYLSTLGARFLYLSGIFLASCCAILFGILEWCPPGTIFVVMAVLCRVVEALGCSMCQTASMAIVANEFPDRVATVMGMLETFAGLGLMAGPPIGGALYELGGFYLPFAVMGVVLMLTGVVAAFILPQSIIAPPKDRAKLFRSFIKVPTTLICGLCVAVCANMITFLDPVFSNQLASIDPNLASSEALIGLVFLVEPSLYALSSPAVGYISDIASRPMLLMIVGNAGFVLSYLFLGPSPLLPFLPPKTLWLTILSYGSLGLFISFCFMPAFSAMNKASVDAGLPNDIDLFGLIAGFFGSAFNFGAFFGPILGGSLVQIVGFEWGTTIVAIAPLINATILTIFCVYTWRSGA